MSRARVQGRPPRRRASIDWLRRVGLSVVAVLVVVLGLVWVRLQTVETGYVLPRARGLERRLQQEQRALVLEVATFMSRRRLATQARTRLGMGPPAAGQIVSVPAPPVEVARRLAARSGRGEGRW